MQFTILFKGGRRYAVQMGQRTVGYDFLQKARSQFPATPEHKISCFLSMTYEKDYELYLTESQARTCNFWYTESNGWQYRFFDQHCQLLCWVAHGALNHAVEIHPYDDGGTIVPVYWVNPVTVYNWWLNHMYEFGYSYWCRIHKAPS